MPTPTPWARFYFPSGYAPSSTGAPIPGSTLSFYESASSTPLDTFADDALQQKNPNPVVADQNGVFPDIFLQAQSYRVVWADQTGKELRTWDPVAPVVLPSGSVVTTALLEVTVDGNNQTPPVGTCGDLFVPFACTINQAVLQADQPGDVVVDVWAAPFVTNTPPTSSNSIVAAAPPTLASAQSMSDTTLAGWDTAIAAQTALRFNIRSIDTLFRFTLTLVCSVVVPA